MEKHDIENTLRSLSKGALPQLPTNFDQSVWREIRSRKAHSVHESVWEMFVTAFLRPEWTVSAAALTLVVSVGFGSFENSTPHSAEHRSLDLGVFSASAPTLPSTLLARTR